MLPSFMFCLIPGDFQHKINDNPLLPGATGRPPVLPNKFFFCLFFYYILANHEYIISTHFTQSILKYDVGYTMYTIANFCTSLYIVRMFRFDDFKDKMHNIINKLFLMSVTECES